MQNAGVLTDSAKIKGALSIEIPTRVVVVL